METIKARKRHRYRNHQMKHENPVYESSRRSSEKQPRANHKFIYRSSNGLTAPVNSHHASLECLAATSVNNEDTSNKDHQIEHDAALNPKQIETTISRNPGDSLVGWSKDKDGAGEPLLIHRYARMQRDKPDILVKHMQQQRRKLTTGAGHLRSLLDPGYSNNGNKTNKCRSADGNTKRRLGNTTVVTKFEEPIGTKNNGSVSSIGLEIDNGITVNYRQHPYEGQTHGNVDNEYANIYETVNGHDLNASTDFMSQASCDHTITNNISTQHAPINNISNPIKPAVSSQITATNIDMTSSCVSVENNPGTMANIREGNMNNEEQDHARFVKINQNAHITSMQTGPKVRPSTAIGTQTVSCAINEDISKIYRDAQSYKDVEDIDLNYLDNSDEGDELDEIDKVHFEHEDNSTEPVKETDIKELRQRLTSRRPFSAAPMATKRQNQNEVKPIRPRTSHAETYDRVKSHNRMFDTANRVGEILDKIRNESNERRGQRTPNQNTGLSSKTVNQSKRTHNRYKDAFNVNQKSEPNLRRAKSAGAKLNVNSSSSRFAPVNRHAWKSNAARRRSNVGEQNKDSLHRFRRAARLVVNILRIRKHMTSVSEEITTRTAVEMQWYELHVSKEAKKLAFDASLFSRERATARVPKWARAILEKPASSRSEDDCRRLHAMLRGLKNFDKFTEQIQMAMCRAFQYHRVESMRVILRKGHIGFNFYFIYSGSVFINVEDKTSDGTSFIRTECILGVGDSFGEVALLKDVPRGATVTSRESCELLVVDKEIFALVCPRIFDIELEQKVKFVSNLDLFNGKFWSDTLIRDMCFEAQIQEYKTNKVVVSDSSTEEWLYINMKGRCRIIKCLWLHDQIDEDPTDHSNQEQQKDDQDDLTIEFLTTMDQSRDSDPGSAADPNRDQRRDHVTFAAMPTVEEEGGGMGQFLAPPRPINASLRRGSQIVRKADLLDSMDLDYVKAQKKSSEEESTPELDKRLPPKQRRLSQHGVMSLTSLMRQKREDIGGREEFVYLDIGSLSAGDVFDLSETLHPSKKQLYRKSCLLLVSSGACVLRIKKKSFLSCATQQGLEHARHLAKRQSYPSNAVLMKSFKETQKWDEYRNEVLSDTVLNFMHLKRWQHLHSIHGSTLTASKKERRRVLRRLKQDDTLSSQNSIFQNDLALDLDDGPISSEFESRMLSDADVGDNRHVLKPLIPEVVHRRKSMFGTKTITVQQSNQIRAGDFRTEMGTVLNLMNIRLDAIPSESS